MLNVDLFPGPGVDEMVNLYDIPWEWPDDHFSFVYVSHFLEHVPHGPDPSLDLFYQVMGEMLRVIKPGGHLEVYSPHPQGPHALEPPGHHRHIGPMTFKPWTVDWNCSTEATNLRGKKRLELLKRKTYRRLQVGPLSDYHFRRYARLEVGHPANIRLLYRVVMG